MTLIPTTSNFTLSSWGSQSSALKLDFFWCKMNTVAMNGLYKKQMKQCLQNTGIFKYAQQTSVPLPRMQHLHLLLCIVAHTQ